MTDRKNKIPFNKPFIIGKELDYIAQTISNLHLSGDGPYTKQCHKWLEKRLGCDKAFLTHSGTGALEMAAILCNLAPGDEVIMPSFTFVSTANAFVLRGAVPVFVDIRPDTLNINEKKINQAISSRTKVIVPMHYGGVSCAMDEIMKIAAHYDLFVVEDAAQAMLSKYKRKFLGTLGHLGCLSFHETKNIISGEGGALLINDKRLVERAEIIWEKGTNRKKFFKKEVDKYSWVDIGSSFLPSEMVGAFLYAQLEQADKVVANRSQIFQKYYQSLSVIEQKGFIKRPYRESNNHIFYIIVRSTEIRNKLIKYLCDSGISSTFHYIPLHSSPAGRKFGKTSGDLRYTNEISEKLIRLPMYYGMHDKDIKKVVSKIKEFYGTI